MATTATKNPVGWFELPVSDMKRAQTFYAKSLGYAFGPLTELEGFEMSFFPMERDVTGAAGALVRGAGYTPSHQGTLVYFNVEDIASIEKKIAQNGGQVYKPKTSIGEYGFISICEDSEGNRIALHSTH